MKDLLADLVKRVAALEAAKVKNEATTITPFNRAYFSAYASGTTSLSGANTKVALAGTTSNDGHFSTVNSNYTCPVAGRYLFTGCVGMTTSGSGPIIVTLFSNNAEIARGYQDNLAGATYHQIVVCAILLCAANDVIDMRAWATAGGSTQAGSAYTYLMGQIQ